MSSRNIVLSSETLTLLLQHATAHSGSVQLVINNSESTEQGNDEVDVQAADTVYASQVPQIENIKSSSTILGLTPEQNQPSVASQEEVTELKAELSMIKNAVHQVVTAFLANRKLANDIDVAENFDPQASSCMCEVLDVVTKHIMNYKRIEMAVANLNDKLSKTTNSMNNLMQSSQHTRKKLELVSQAPTMEDVLKELQSLFQTKSISPGPLFITKDVFDSHEQKPLTTEQVLNNTVAEAEDDQTAVDEAVYNVKKEQNLSKGQIREDGTYDDCVSEMADYDEEDANSDSDEIVADSNRDSREPDLPEEHVTDNVTTNNVPTDNILSGRGVRKSGRKRSILHAVVKEKENTTEEIEDIKDEDEPKKRNRKKVEIPTKEARHVCKYCGKSNFTGPTALYDHIRTHTGEKPYKCTTCNQAFRLAHYLKEHMYTHTGERPYVCETCGSKFQKASIFSDHKKIHAKSHKCNVCNRVFSMKNHLAIHMRRHTGERPYICDLCGLAFSMSYPLKKHMLTAHSNSTSGSQQEEDVKADTNRKKNTTCEVCNKVVRLYGLKQHMATHTQDKPYKCKYCDQSFVQKQNWVYHVRRHNNELNYKCTVCDKAFAMKGILNSHMKTHSEENIRSLTCPYCDKSLCNKDSFQNHMVLHTDEKKFQCQHCDRMFYTIRSCRDHMKRVHGGKQFQCDVCGRNLASRSGLVHHKRIHTGEKPYSCSQCHATFRKLDSLKFHLKFDRHKTSMIQQNHDEAKVALTVDMALESISEKFKSVQEMKYRCGQCGEQFSHKSQLHTHSEKCDSTVFVMLGEESEDNSFEATEMQIAESHVEVPESHTQVPESHLEVPESHMEVPESHMEVPESHTQVPESHMEVPESHTQVPESHTQVPESHTQVPESHTQVPESHTLAESHMEVPGGHMHVPESHVEIPESHMEIPESHTQVAERHTLAESHMEVRESHTQVPESHMEVWKITHHN